MTSFEDFIIYLKKFNPNLELKEIDVAATFKVIVSENNLSIKEVMACYGAIAGTQKGQDFIKETLCKPLSSGESLSNFELKCSLIISGVLK